jgi:hypothetical protein
LVDVGKVKSSTVKLYDNPVRIENAHFMEVSLIPLPFYSLQWLTVAVIFHFSQPVIKLWLHDISKSLPQCAAEAF